MGERTEFCQSTQEVILTRSPRHTWGPSIRLIFAALKYIYTSAAGERIKTLADVRKFYVTNWK